MKRAIAHRIESNRNGNFSDSMSFPLRDEVRDMSISGKSYFGHAIFYNFLKQWKAIALWSHPDFFHRCARNNSTVDISVIFLDFWGIN